MKKYLLRFGIPTILAVMFAGIMLMLHSFEIRTKTTATLVVSDEGRLKVYVARTEGTFLQVADTVRIDQTVAGSLALCIDSIREEPAASVLYVHLPDGNPRRLCQQLEGNTLATGYVFAQSVRLKSLFFKRIGR